jgi:lipopolysaccharide transport system ATP-binding protein
MSRGFAIDARGLGKRYVLAGGRPRHNSLRDAVAESVARLVRRAPPTGTASEFWALRDATFSIRHGENVGIVGLNGAGKSTLLKILSRITEPTAGLARIEGRVGALLEVGTGFHGELSGRENVFLYGSILGMTRKEVQRKFDAIVEFSGVRQFIDTPVKRYSSGMYVRLAFAVAAHLDPDILLLDEVLAVGDLAFQRKCIEFAKSLQRRDATILFVSHNMFSIKTMCDRVIYLRRGEIVFDGPVEAGIELYDRDCDLADLSWTDTDPATWPIRIESCDLFDREDRRANVFDFGESMKIRLKFRTSKPVHKPNFIVAFIRSDGVACCNYSSETDSCSFDLDVGDGEISIETPPLRLVAESYTISIIVREPGMQAIICGQMGGTFHVRHDLFDMNFGVFHENAKWSGSETEPRLSAHDAASQSQAAAHLP